MEARAENQRQLIMSLVFCYEKQYQEKTNALLAQVISSTNAILN